MTLPFPVLLLLSSSALVSLSTTVVIFIPVPEVLAAVAPAALPVCLRTSYPYFPIPLCSTFWPITCGTLSS